MPLVVAAAEAGDMQALFNSSQELSEVAKMMANELIKKANATKDPQERARLLALADEIKRAALDVIAAAKNYAQVSLKTWCPVYRVMNIP